jgi:uncharacterized protein (TIGR02598 family)
VKLIPCSQISFSLVEVTLALGVAAICLVSIFTLLPAGLRTHQNAIEEAASADVLGEVIADLRATSVTTPRGRQTVSPQCGITIPANPVSAAVTSTLYFTSEGRVSPTANANSRYLLTIVFVPNGTGSRRATLADLKMTWPATAAPNNANGSVEMFAALDRN